jgi:hypothetical protein
MWVAHLLSVTEVMVIRGDRFAVRKTKPERLTVIDRIIFVQAVAKKNTIVLEVISCSHLLRTVK